MRIIARALILALAGCWCAAGVAQAAQGPSSEENEQSSQQQSASQQGGTADQWRAQREAKRSQLAPPEKDNIEAGLSWLETNYVIQRIRAGWHGFHPLMGGFPSGSGQAFGVNWQATGSAAKYPDEFTPNRLDLTATAAASIRGYFLVGVDVGFLRIGGTPLNYQVHGGYQRNSQDDFFGFGPNSLEDDRTNYLLEGSGGGTVVWWQAPRWLYVGGGVGYREFNVGPGTDSRFPSTEEVFDPTGIPGLEEHGAFIRYDGFVQIDWRNRGNPHMGGFYGFRYTDWRDQDFGKFDFRQLEVDLQQYFPFLMDKRVIALRAKTILTDTDAGQDVPFYLQPRLGGSKELRGFRYARFTDLNSLLLAAEYRAELWLAMDLALFAEAGKVFEDHDDLNFSDLETDYGIGFRLKTEQSTFLRADIAFGGEGIRLYITFDNAFDDVPLFRRTLRNTQ